MIKVGLTGGIATGKSTVLRMLREMELEVVDVDEISRELTRKGRPGYERVVEAFGSEILNESGEIDRKRLAGIVFSDKEKKRLLESILHPLILTELRRRLEEIESRRPCAPVVIEVPLLFEVGAHRNMDFNVVVWAPRELQIKRLVERDGLDPSEAEKRLESQMPVDEKKKLADFVIDNSGPLERTRFQVEELVRLLKTGRWRECLKRRS